MTLLDAHYNVCSIRLLGERNLFCLVRILFHFDLFRLPALWQSLLHFVRVR